MNFSIIEAEQRSPEWFAARSGRLTGSRARDMLAKIQKGEAAARRDYRMQLACERLTGVPMEDDYINKEMQRGIDKEPDAIGEYEADTGLLVQRTGFICSDDFLAGCSLDGHIGTFDGILEVKCPKSTTHIAWMKAGVVPSEHLPQLKHNCWITGAMFADFVSFDDRLPTGLQFFRVRYVPSEKDLLEYELAASLFLSEVEEEVKALSALRAA